VAELRSRGVVFDLEPDGELSLGLEGGHTRRRIVHSGGSATGHEITSKLAAMVAAQPRIEVRERASMTALWSDGERCHGLLTDDGQIAAPATVLATGGAAALWRRTSNPRGAIGAGPTMAAAAGADLADLEFLQFHPTAVKGIKGREGFLVTEAIRGEGATLHGPDGERFVDELAPRDEVARAIDALLRETGEESVGLDMRDVDPALFPNVVAALSDAGLDPTQRPIPVSPASHYMMGGIVTDLHGRTTVAGLFAVGETACTGLHGANRLASNSLSECFVFGARAATAALDEDDPGAPPAGVQPPPPAALVKPQRATQDALWRDAGLVRTRAGLERLLDDPNALARLIATCALHREESRGAHQRADFPATDAALDHLHAVVGADGRPRMVLWR
jgi:L-aspartate oxidase